MNKWFIVGICLAVVGFLVLSGLFVISCSSIQQETATLAASATAQAVTKSLLRSNIATSGTNSGTISGTITDLITENPLAGVSVEADGIKTTTNSSGNYALTGLTAGSINVVITATGYENISIRCNSSIVNVALLPDERSPSGTLTGVLTDASGNPVANAGIFAASSTYFQETANRTVTDALGRFTLETDAGDVLIVASSITVESGVMKGIASAYRRLTLVAGSTQEVNIQFPADQPTISGTVTNTTTLTKEGFYATPVAGNAMMIAGGHFYGVSSYNSAIPITQGSDRLFVFAGAGSNRWYWDGDYVTVSSGENITKNFTIGNPIELTSPVSNADVTSTPTFTWELGTGNSFDFYIVDIWTQVSPTQNIRVRRMFTEDTSYVLSGGEALAAGTYTWSISGFEVEDYTRTSHFVPSEMTIDNWSQDTINGSFTIL